MTLQGAEVDNPKRLRGEVIARSNLEWSENKRRWAEGLASQKKIPFHKKHQIN
jgi:hypothetical protein